MAESRTCRGPLLAGAEFSPLFQAPVQFKQGWLMMERGGTFSSHFQGIRAEVGKHGHSTKDREENNLS